MAKDPSPGKVLRALQSVSMAVTPCLQVEDWPSGGFAKSAAKRATSNLHGPAGCSAGVRPQPSRSGTGGGGSCLP